jgi:hypothetical protein
MSAENYAFLNDDSQWRKAFPNGMVPIQNVLIPQRGETIGDGIQDFYSVDVAKLSAPQIDLIAQMVSEQCGGPPAEIKADMVKRGMIPLRAKHVRSTSTNVPFFL